MPERHVNPYETHIPTHQGFEWCAVFVPRAYCKVIRANNVATRGEIAQQAEWIVKKDRRGAVRPAESVTPSMNSGTT